MPESKLNVMFVDDEPNILLGMRRNLRSMQKSWEMVFAGSADEALSHMQDHPVDVLISDLRMPGKDGIELLNAVREKSPHTLRFIMSGLADRNMILESVGLAHQFFTKPCKADTLVNSVNRTCAVNDLLNRDSIKDVISKLRNIPSPPHLYEQIRKELDKPDTSLEKVTQLIQQDAATTAKILQLVNSAFFGMPQEISDVNQALMLLGVEILKSLILMVGFTSSWERKLGGYINAKNFSAHCLQVANLSRDIATDLKLPKRDRENAFSAGLLHDLGKLILASIDPRQYAEILRRSESGAVSLSQLEAQRFGGSHNAVGAYLLNIWGLPFPVVEATAYHHDPNEIAKNKSSEESLCTTAIIHIANGLASEAPLNTEEGNENPDLLSWDFLRDHKLEKEAKSWRNRLLIVPARS